MYPPIFEAVNVPAVQALLKTGKDPLRFYLFGMAPQGVKYPYAVWRLVTATPENYLADRPDIDGQTVQVDVFASPSQGASVARQVSTALSYAIEGHAYITSWLGESIDPDTKNPTSKFQVDWLTPR